MNKLNTIDPSISGCGSADSVELRCKAEKDSKIGFTDFTVAVSLNLMFRCTSATRHNFPDNGDCGDQSDAMNIIGKLKPAHHREE